MQSQTTDFRRAPRIALPLSNPVIAGLFLLAFVLLQCVSSMLLTEWGYNYEESGGSPLEKMHPGTLLMAATLGLAILATGRPVAWLVGQIERAPGTFLLLAGTVLMMIHSARVVQVPFTNFIDTFVLPAIVFLMLIDTKEPLLRRMALLMHAMMAINALIGIGEFVTGERLVPFWIAGQIEAGDWRSTALLGHPLSNASLTGSYVVAMLVGGGRDLSPVLRGFCLALNAAAMVPFGGRAATVLVILMIAVVLGLHVQRVLRGQRFTRMQVVGLMLFLPFAAAGILVLAQTGFFEKFAERFIDDEGSAQTRVGMFDLLFSLPLAELMFAPDALHVDTMRRVFGLDYGIESFWISFIVLYGIVPSIAFFIVLGLFCREVIRAGGSGGVWVFLFFFVVASTSVSLSGKGPQLALIVIQVMTMLRRRSDGASVAPAATSAEARPPGRLAVDDGLAHR